MQFIIKIRGTADLLRRVVERGLLTHRPENRGSEYLWNTSTRLQVATTQKTSIFMLATVRT